MAELNVDLTRLPDDVREKLAELELELSEGKYPYFTAFTLLPSRPNDWIAAVSVHC